MIPGKFEKEMGDFPFKTRERKKGLFQTKLTQNERGDRVFFFQEKEGYGIISILYMIWI